MLGTSYFTLACAKAILDAGCEISLMVTLPKTLLPLCSANIMKFSESQGLPWIESEDINSEKTLTYLRKYNPDYIFSSWPMILKEKILKLPKYYCIGSHPTDLPHNRGRHPLHWLIILGYQESKISFFVMTEGVDSGDLISQESFQISSTDTIREVNESMNVAAYRGIITLCRNLLAGERLVRVSQEKEQANHWRKRGLFDCIIDPRMSAEAIIKLVRSFSPPYPCVKLIASENKVLNIESAEFVNFQDEIALKRKEPGSILSVMKKYIVIKADDKPVKLNTLEVISQSFFEKNRYVYPPLKYLETVKAM